MTSEDQRALDWQAQQRDRAAFERSLQAKLKAPTDKLITTKKAWDPLLQLNAYPDPTEQCWEPTPLEMR